MYFDRLALLVFFPLVVVAGIMATILVGEETVGATATERALVNTRTLMSIT